MQETVTGICGVCPSGCGVRIHKEAGRIKRITPLAGHPLGYVCRRGVHAEEVVYSEDRLLHPMRRTKGGLQRISWDDAYDLIIAALHEIAKQHGPEAVCIYTGRGSFERGLNDHFAPSNTNETSANAVLFPFGSPNTTGVGALCYVAYGMIAPRACFGEDILDLKEDLDNAGLILVWGANPATDSPPIDLHRLKRAKKRGAEIIVIDHLRNETARSTKAEWIGVRPGTDGALALAMIAVLIEEERYDKAFVSDWTHGFADLADYVKRFIPEVVERITRVPAERIRALARQIAEAKGCAILMYTGLEYSNSGVQAIRAVWILQALAGHLDVPGGKLFKMRDRFALQRTQTDPPSTPQPIGSTQYPIYYETRNEAHGVCLPQAILEDDPYPVRGLIVGGASLITSWPDPERWRRALDALDLLVVVNRFPTADAEYADLLLPATTGFEISSYMVHDGFVQYRPRIIEPVGEARNDYLIYAELARRLGYGERWPQTEAALIRHALSGSVVSYEQLVSQPEGIRLPDPPMRYRKYETGDLRADGQPGFNTPTKKLEIASQWLKKHGHEPLPVYTEPVEGPLTAPELAERFPLVFNSGARTNTDFRSQHHNIPSLLERAPCPLVQIHPEDARARGIEDGDEVDVVTDRGRVRFWAKVTENIQPGVVEVNMGGGGPIGGRHWQGANVNLLTDLDNRDPISGFPVYKALLCDVTRASDHRGRA